jgi:hypothetical protein
MTKKKIIHVHRQLMQQGKPAIIVREAGRAQHFSKVEVLGPSTIVHEPDRPRQPRVWIETHAEVEGS